MSPAALTVDPAALDHHRRQPVQGVRHPVHLHGDGVLHVGPRERRHVELGDADQCGRAAVAPRAGTRSRSRPPRGPVSRTTRSRTCQARSRSATRRRHRRRRRDDPGNDSGLGLGRGDGPGRRPDGDAGGREPAGNGTATVVRTARSPTRRRAPSRDGTRSRSRAATTHRRPACDTGTVTVTVDPGGGAETPRDERGRDRRGRRPGERHR